MIITGKSKILCGILIVTLMIYLYKKFIKGKNEFSESDEDSDSGSIFDKIRSGSNKKNDKKKQEVEIVDKNKINKLVNEILQRQIPNQ